MARSVEDTMFVLHAISGADAGDVSSVSRPLDFNSSEVVKGLRVGYFPPWMKENPATDVGPLGAGDDQEGWDGPG